MLLAPAALLGVRGEVWVDPDAASRCPMLTYRWIHQPGLLDLQLHSDTSVMARWSTVPGTLHSELHMRERQPPGQRFDRVYSGQARKHVLNGLRPGVEYDVALALVAAKAPSNWGDGLHGQLVSPDMGYGGAVATTDCGYVVRLRADTDEL